MAQKPAAATVLYKFNATNSMNSTISPENKRFPKKSGIMPDGLVGAAGFRVASQGLLEPITAMANVPGVVAFW